MREPSATRLGAVADAGGAPRMAGVWRTGGAVVWWQIARHGDDESGSAAARRCLERLVVGEALAPWRGLSQAPAGEKPTLRGAYEVDVSMSHSRGAVLVAAATGACVGADIECAPFDAFDSLALRRRMLTPDEHDVLRTVPASRRRHHLAELWTAKEAAVKCTGRGLRDDFREFSAPGSDAPSHGPWVACLAVQDIDGVRFNYLGPAPA